MILHAMGKDAAPAAPTTGETGSGTGTGAVPPIVSEGAVFPGGGCSSSGPQSAWLLLPLIGLVLLRRRRSAA
jgi:MYXO-CTERM domain-containing protein